MWVVWRQISFKANRGLVMVEWSRGANWSSRGNGLPFQVSQVSWSSTWGPGVWDTLPIAGCPNHGTPDFPDPVHTPLLSLLPNLCTCPYLRSLLDTLVCWSQAKFSSGDSNVFRHTQCPDIDGQRRAVADLRLRTIWLFAEQRRMPTILFTLDRSQHLVRSPAKLKYA